MTEDTRYTGTIIHTSPDGYGFITTPEIPFTRIFFHWGALDHRIKFLDLSKGQAVTFQVKEYPDKGLRAIKIQLVGDSNESKSDSGTN
jgi:cold shock CspA family protein